MNIAPLWAFWFSVWETDPDDYYVWQAELLSERAPA